MRILIYQHQYPAFGGIETVTTLLAQQFVEDGHEVKIVSLRSRQGTTLLEVLSTAVCVVQLPQDVFSSETNRSALVRILDEFKPDVVVFQDSYAPIEDTLFNALAECENVHPIRIIVEHSIPKIPDVSGEIVFTHGVVRLMRGIVGKLLTPYRYVKRVRFERERRRRLYVAADKYVFLTPRYITISNRIAGVARCEKLTAIPNPIRPATMDVDLLAKRKEVLFCGSLFKLKAVDRLVDIWSRLEAKHPEWSFTIVGDGEERGNLESQVKRLGLKRVSFEGFQENPEPYYHRASIFAMVSSFEGWPMVLGEAMQQGCVPIAYDSFAALYDIVEDGKSGRIIKFKDEDAFVAALDEMMLNADALAALQQGTIVKSGAFALETIIKQWYELFASVKGEVN